MVSAVVPVVLLLIALGLYLAGFTSIDWFPLLSGSNFALGYLAAGQFSVGIFAAGTFAVGFFAAGIFAIGIFSIGIYALGIYLVYRFEPEKKCEDKQKHSQPQHDIQRVTDSCIGYSLHMSTANLQVAK